ncbi:glycosyltransferase [Aquabacterium sp. A08]|uniref:glycosyltransferase family 2 protein n=1 Tax=Aquabacterium sp. A08 TaxID=2718532 RepID=UPI001421B20F|nr:glycosyltransferase [Aquabacterium sp. A08]
MIDFRPSTPTVSVVLPVYNGGLYLPLALDSILAQRYTDFELLVIDDGSTDQSLAVLQAYAAQDPRVRVVSRANQGLVATLNEAIGLAQGRYIARMDADDIALPDRLGLQVAYLDSNPQCVCVGSAVELMDELGRKLVVWPQYPDNETIQREALKGHTTICHPAATMRKDALVASGGYRASMYPTEDLDLWLRLGELGQLANLPKVLLRYRMHSGSISGQAAKDGRQREAARKCCDEACERRGLADKTFEASEAWRPDGTQQAQWENDLKFGWWAMASHEYSTAIAYGWRAWRVAPFSRPATVLLLKSIWQRMLSKA